MAEPTREHIFDQGHFERGPRWPREKSLQKFRDAIRQKIPRMRSGPMSQIVGEANRTLRGWFEYFKHSIANSK
jgi:RNA-directed DNA polymerase